MSLQFLAHQRAAGAHAALRERFLQKPSKDLAGQPSQRALEWLNQGGVERPLGVPPRSPRAQSSMIPRELEADVLGKLRRAEITQARAAELLKVSLDDLLEKVARAEVLSFDMTEGELEMELAIPLPVRRVRPG